MAVTATIHRKGLELILKGDVDFDNNSFKVMLLTNSHSINATTQEYVADVVVNELNAINGYTVGGKEITNIEVGVDPLAIVFVQASDVIWEQIKGNNLRYAIVYKDTGEQSTSPLIFVLNFGATYNMDYQDLTIAWFVGEVLTLRQA